MQFAYPRQMAIHLWRLG